MDHARNTATLERWIGPVDRYAVSPLTEVDFYHYDVCVARMFRGELHVMLEAVELMRDEGTVYFGAIPQYSLILSNDHLSVTFGDSNAMALQHRFSTIRKRIELPLGWLEVVAKCY